MIAAMKGKGIAQNTLESIVAKRKHERRHTSLSPHAITFVQDVYEPAR
jgi:hypothetical protein